jgi:molecular chaperone GrpE
VSEDDALSDAVVPVTGDGDLTAEQQRAQAVEDRLSQVLTAYRKLKAENADFRERMSRNIARRFDDRRERLLIKFIDILDNLDRALEAAERSNVTESLIDGLILVRVQLLQALQDEGLERAPVLGLPYDPALAEAMGTAPVDTKEHDHVVVKELLRAYRFEGRVIRHGQVLVGQFEDDSGADEAPAEAGQVRAPDEEPQEAVEVRPPDEEPPPELDAGSSEEEEEEVSLPADPDDDDER